MILVKGYRNTQVHWSRMRAALEACQVAGVPVPEEITAFFAANRKTVEPVFFYSYGAIPSAGLSIGIPEGVVEITIERTDS